jgi:hypothetical protein
MAEGHEGARMPSQSLTLWFADRAATLDEMENAHRFVRGTGQAVRTTTQQINQAYAVLLSAQFQGFCRDFHSECAEALVAPITALDLQRMLWSSLVFGRKLDRGNPNVGNIGSDFGRFGLPFWPLVDARQANNPARRVSLDELNEWRNAIAHQDFAISMLRSGVPILTLAQVRGWRKCCDVLARSFDEVVKQHVQRLTGTAPW